ncbi:reverse transcriptase domain-containing protein [Tanacetum coccineum]
MHIWCGRRSIPRPRRQHARNQSLPREDESGNEATITSNIERSSKPKREAGEFKQILIQVHGKITPLLQNLEKPGKHSMEKLVLALVHATRRLRRYFQAHPIVVITDQPIKQILSRPENTRRMLKWKFKLEAFDITYRPRTSIRGQILADFITEKPNEEGPSMEVQAEEAIPEPWTLFTDGSSCLEGSGAGLILTSPEGKEFTYALRFEFDASNNEAEAKEQSMTRYLEKAETLINNFKMFSIEQVSRSENKKADALSKIASTSFAHLTKQVLVETLKRKSIEEREILAIVEEEGYCWMTPLVEYLTEGTLPAKTKKARAIKIKARRYTMVNGVLYRKSFLEPWLRDNPFKYWCEKLNIKQRFATVKHPQTNSQVERANRSLGEGIKARLGENNRNWVEEVPHVLWAHRTMIKTSSGDTLFSLTYGTKAVIPVEIGMPSLRYAEVNQAKNENRLLLNLDILEERREKAVVREARSKAKMEKYYNAKVRSTSFRPGDFVCRSNEASHAKESGKLGPK